MEIIGNIDSKYRFVILASKRAKQLLKGAKPKIKAKTKNLIRIAQTEVRSGLIEYDVLPAPNDDIEDKDESMFVGDELAVGLPDAEDISEPVSEDDEPDIEDEEEEGSEDDETDAEDSSEDMEDDAKE